PELQGLPEKEGEAFRRRLAEEIEKERHWLEPIADGEQFGRFRRKDFHARGGLGEVYRATDEEVGKRAAALKLIQAKADNPSARRQLLREAEITALLDHPGVVPIYGLGTKDGRPFYAMRFVEGESLNDAIKAFYEKAGKGDDSEARRLGLLGLVA